MHRLDLPEIADQPWCPRWLRDAMTGYLQVVIEMARPYEVAVPALSRLLESTDRKEVLDLASGAGGPWRQLSASLRQDRPSLQVTLTDLNPNESTVALLRSVDGLDYLPDGVSALEPPVDRGAVRTMFTALHHFDRADVRRIFSSAQSDRVSFAAYEATQRSLRGLLVTLFIPLLVWVLMPRVKPRRFVSLVLTYVPPLLPLLIWWDGLASTLRTYSVEELRELTAEIEDPGYSWDIKEVPVRGAPIPVLEVIGRPVRIAGPGS